MRIAIYQGQATVIIEAFKPRVAGAALVEVTAESQVVLLAFSLFQCLVDVFFVFVEPELLGCLRQLHFFGRQFELEFVDELLLRFNLVVQLLLVTLHLLAVKLALFLVAVQFVLESLLPLLKLLLQLRLVDVLVFYFGLLNRAAMLVLRDFALKGLNAVPAFSEQVSHMLLGLLVGSLCTTLLLLVLLDHLAVTNTPPALATSLPLRPSGNLPARKPAESLCARQLALV